MNANEGSMIAVLYKPCSSPLSVLCKDSNLSQIPVYDNCIFSADVMLLILEKILECVRFRKHTISRWAFTLIFPINAHANSLIVIEQLKHVRVLQMFIFPCKVRHFLLWICSIISGIPL